MNKYLTPKDVRDVLGIGITNVYRLFRLTDFPCIRIGHRMFVKENDLESFLEEYRKSKIILPI